MNDAVLLVRALRDPASTATLTDRDWTALIAVARAEVLIGSLAHRLHGLPLPPRVSDLLESARASAAVQRTQALWEAEMARRALAPLGCRVVLLKGTAYVAAGLGAGTGRSIGDLDIMVARDQLDAVQAALLEAGWQWVKPDAYDDAYYRDHMHELPPMIHAARDRMIDVHHTILPLTARIRPDAKALLADATPLGNGLFTLSPADMIVHSAAHLFADGDLSGGLRNLWDIHQLLGESTDAAFVDTLSGHARLHGLEAELARAMRLAAAVYGAGRCPLSPADRLYLRRLTARDEWGRATRPLTRLLFYIRSHWLRMPPLMLARHLWIKWRR